MGFLDLTHNRFIFFPRCSVNLIMFVDTCNRKVGGHLNNAKLVDLCKFFGFGDSRSRHPCEFVIKAEKVLKGDACQSDVFGLNGTAFFRLNCLMQSVGQPAARHHPSGKFVNQHNFASTHNVVFVTGKQLMGIQSLIDVMDDGCAFRIIKRLIFWQKPTGV